MCQGAEYTGTRAVGVRDNATDVLAPHEPCQAADIETGSIDVYCFQASMATSLRASISRRMAVWVRRLLTKSTSGSGTWSRQNRCR
jgi:hypothetical protein